MISQAMDPYGLIERCWTAVGGDPAALAGLSISAREQWLGGPLSTDELALGAVGAELLAAAELAAARGRERPGAALSGEHVAVSFRSERHARAGHSSAAVGFAPLSRFVRCDGGWIRTHGNYPHHAAALGRALGVTFTGEPESDARLLLEAAADMPPQTLEERVFAEGGCAAATRTAHEWRLHPAGACACALAIIDCEHRVARIAPCRLGPCDDAAQPAAGVRVLDLTRVIAGPVAGRSLAALGAEVLRIDPPQLPELPDQHLDTGAGKRSALLDLADRERREALLAGADVLLSGYRPGALARFGLDPADLAARHPHLIHISLSAWGAKGPWADRRGFDSLVQAACGIAAHCAAPDGTPGALPAQVLDHATGHLMAAAALRALAARARGEPIAPARLALARTAAMLLDAPPPPQSRGAATGRADPERFRVSFGDVSLIAPPGQLAGKPLCWRHGPRRLGGDEPAWL